MSSMFNFIPVSSSTCQQLRIIATRTLYTAFFRTIEIHVIFNCNSNVLWGLFNLNQSQKKQDQYKAGLFNLNSEPGKNRMPAVFRSQEPKILTSRTAVPTKSPFSSSSIPAGSSNKNFPTGTLTWNFDISYR